MNKINPIEHTELKLLEHSDNNECNRQRKSHSSTTQKNLKWQKIIESAVLKLESLSEVRDSIETFHIMRIIRKLLRSQGKHMKERLDIITRNTILAHSDVLVRV